MKESKICALCQKNEADKTNTHYFTDVLIKQTLNEDGSNQRDKTTSFEISNASIKNNLKGTSPEKINDLLGREATDEEIEEWKDTLVCSVDNVFCKECESLFADIENEFTGKILPKLRPSFIGKGTEDLLDDVTKDNSSIKFSDNETVVIHLFFYVQIWRSHICEPAFRICDENTIEILRNIILNYKNAKMKDIKSIPLIIYYLKTPSRKEYTRNEVIKCNNSLMINDFQVLVGESNIANQNESKFSINIYSNEERDKILEAITRDKASIFMEDKAKRFAEVWLTCVGSEPNSVLIQEYKNNYVDYMGSLAEGLRYTKEETIKHLSSFMQERLKY